ncbi:MAG: hypothetical protein ACI8W7_001054 [Gammaproteobacteria bacterium]|jgi:hypothetical protein
MIMTNRSSLLVLCAEYEERHETHDLEKNRRFAQPLATKSLGRGHPLKAKIAK